MNRRHYRRSDFAGPIGLSQDLGFVEQTKLHTSTPDKLLWKWTADHTFSNASAYQAFCPGQFSVAGSKTLWKTRASGKCKLFGWLVIHDHCWTAERRKRHNLQQHDFCALCNQESKTISHLLVGCSFSRLI